MMAPALTAFLRARTGFALGEFDVIQEAGGAETDDGGKKSGAAEGAGQLFEGGIVGEADVFDLSKGFGREDLKGG